MVVKGTKSTETFNNKAKLLNLSVDKQVEMLNTMYKGSVTFDRRLNDKVFIKEYKPDVISIELPECESLDMDRLLKFDLLILKNKLTSIKLPRCIKCFDLSSAWVIKVKRIFMWDTTELIYRDYDSNYGNLEMVIIQSTQGGKPKIYKFK